MKSIITKTRLLEIIAEEYGAVKNKMSDREKIKRNTKKKQEQRKDDDMRFGGESIRQLARGIAEFNRGHDRLGKFSDQKDTTSTSSYFVDGEREREAGGLSKPKAVYGRGKHKNKGKGSRILKSDEPLWEELEDGYVKIKKSSLTDYIADQVEAALTHYNNELENVLEEDSKTDTIAKQCNSYGYRSWIQWVKQLNAIQSASSGDLYKEKK
jgi:hypothetical protein